VFEGVLYVDVDGTSSRCITLVPQQIDTPPQRKPNDAKLANGGKIFTPFWTERVMLKPASIGGANWPPSSYDPESHLLRVWATSRRTLLEDLQQR
jgi:quinohemoprotein ethanol dehydrogenase